ncbi:MAG: hypothetical protein H7210_13185 [Pyrinomonadaceae bacterium]|nr:hypothetical protein [Phycisphaerales bacterium]
MIDPLDLLPAEERDRIRQDATLLERFRQLNPQQESVAGAALLTAPPPGSYKPIRTARPMRADGYASQAESDYAKLLMARVGTGELVCFSRQPLFLLASGTTYAADFLLHFKGGAEEVHEVKGEQVWDDSKVKFAWARAQYPEFGWRMVRRRKGSTEFKEVRVGRGIKLTPQKGQEQRA